MEYRVEKGNVKMQLSFGKHIYMIVFLHLVVEYYWYRNTPLKHDANLFYLKRNLNSELLKFINANKVSVSYLPTFTDFSDELFLLMILNSKHLVKTSLVIVII